MKLTTATILLSAGAAQAAFVPRKTTFARECVAVNGYLDDLTGELYQEVDNPDAGRTKESTNLEKGDVDRFGVGDWESYVDFDEFDGGDGQMGVAGDGNKSLEKFGRDVSPQLAKSKMMSAKNAWGKSTGYADTLIDKGVEEVRAQQLENWHNQQELRDKKREHAKFTDEFDKVTYEEDWRALAKFGVERNQDFDLNEAFGPVVAGDVIEDTVELHASYGGRAVWETKLRNEFMGFADFRMAFTADSSRDFEVHPTEGSIQANKDTEFIVKFAPQGPGVREATLVLETEDFKKTWKIIGSTA
eukprot:CAMPEP_0194046072 /NCGR_PEP_ID=MMETSP0009_2-20130614/19346_1 /TAXON_ID=210454 /ORGANISM="Grammatophora oceanica, Strain CCMP 410" /LENGTH=301 /DNA_ID=CAMNT_0038691211 /DNA_START=26 /DNA_END=931 /DNA_ORIENTATION=+